MTGSGVARRRAAVLGAMGAGLVVVFGLALTLGSVLIPLDQVATILVGGEADRAAWETIVVDIRLPRAITAALAGAALGVAGLQMQTLFRNPLADPFTLGITSGASLGVALLTLAGAGAAGAFASGLGLGAAIGVTAAAGLGAAAVVSLVLVLAGRVRNTVTVLVVGLMVGFTTGSIVSLLIWFADPERISAFVRWGFGTFRTTTWDELKIFAPVVVVALTATALSAKVLNALLLGERYAETMGVRIRRARVAVVITASALAGTVTAFAGPIGFLGIAVPHLARAMLDTNDHRVLVPASVLLGASVALAAEIVAQVPGNDVTLPINAITALIGAPVVVVVLLRASPRSFA